MTLTWKGVHRRLTHGTWTLVKILIIQMKLITKLPTLDWRIINDTPHMSREACNRDDVPPQIFCLWSSAFILNLDIVFSNRRLYFVHPQSYSEELSWRMQTILPFSFLFLSYLIYRCPLLWFCSKNSTYRAIRNHASSLIEKNVSHEHKWQSMRGVFLERDSSLQICKNGILIHILFEALFSSKKEMLIFGLG